METFSLEIITPDASHTTRPIRQLQLPAAEGMMTVLPGHQPHLCLTRAGGARILPAEGEEEQWELGRGTLQVDPGRARLVVRRATRLPQRGADSQPGRVSP